MPLFFMTSHFHPNSLARLRKVTGLTQSDLSLLIGIEDYTGISKCECGARPPNMKILLFYSLVLNQPIESFFRLQSNHVKQGLLERIPELLEKVEAEETSIRRAKRIKHLSETIIRLRAKPYEAQF